MIKKRNAQGLSMNVLIMATMAIIVLVVLIAIFSNQSGKSIKTLESCEGRGGKCEFSSDCSGGLKLDFKECKKDNKICCVKIFKEDV